MKKISELSDEEKCRIIDKYCHLDNRYYLMKRGYFYRPNCAGYTSSHLEAGIYTEEEANKHVYPHYETVTKHLVPPSDYPNDLNLCKNFWDCLGWEEKNEYIEHLKEIVSEADCEVYFATARERMDAFLMFLGYE